MEIRRLDELTMLVKLKTLLDEELLVLITYESVLEYSQGLMEPKSLQISFFVLKYASICCWDTEQSLHDLSYLSKVEEIVRLLWKR